MYPTIVASCNIDSHTVRIECCVHEAEVGMVQVIKNIIKV